MSHKLCARGRAPLFTFEAWLRGEKALLEVFDRETWQTLSPAIRGTPEEEFKALGGEAYLRITSLEESATRAASPS